MSQYCNYDNCNNKNGIPDTQDITYIEHIVETLYTDLWPIILIK